MVKRICVIRWRFMAACAAAMVLLVFPAALLPASAAAEKPLIVIDPGHGGHDKGAEGVSATFEKNVTLRFARVLEKALASEYRVELTRTGDYQVSYQNRASMANHQKADLFISLHSGGFFRVGLESWGVYYYPASKASSPPSTGADNAAPAGDEAGPESTDWRRIQLKHVKVSQTLADALSRHLRACPQIAGVKNAEAPLLQMEGLDMPAVAIEAGYLTHPACEGRLNDPDFLTDAAACVRQGIRAFFRER